MLYEAKYLREAEYLGGCLVLLVGFDGEFGADMHVVDAWVAVGGEPGGAHIDQVMQRWEDKCRPAHLRARRVGSRLLDSFRGWATDR